MSDLHGRVKAAVEKVRQAEMVPPEYIPLEGTAGERLLRAMEANGDAAEAAALRDSPALDAVAHGAAVPEDVGEVPASERDPGPGLG